MAKTDYSFGALAAAAAGVLAAMGSLMLIMAVVQVRPAEATFPGKPGEIFFDRAHVNSGIWAAKPYGTGDRSIFTSSQNGGNTPNDPAVSPDGSKVAFEVLTGKGICVVNIDGSNKRCLTNAGGDPAWSPDGTRIAFVRFNHVGTGDIWKMGADGSSQKNLTNTPDNEEHDPAWSPDGAHIAYWRVFCDPLQKDICVYKMDADGTNQTQLTHLASDATKCGDQTGVIVDHDQSRDPSWSPDGTKIAFTGDVGCVGTSARSGSNIWMMNAEDGDNKVRLISDNETNDQQPVFSPDGTKIAFVSDRDPQDSKREVYVMPADGSTVTRVTNTLADERNPDWSSTSRQKSATRTVSIRNLRFSPTHLTVKPGTKVTWVNKGNAAHTVTASNGLFDSGKLRPGQRFSRTFKAGGKKFAYHCEIHPQIKGSVTVKRRR